MSARSTKEEVKQLLGKLPDDLTWDELMHEMTVVKGAHVRSHFEEPSSTQHLEFLYDKRLTLLNTRREHEWRIYFGAMILLGTSSKQFHLVTDKFHLMTEPTSSSSSVGSGIK